jgi:hypothetical protein
MVLQFPDMQERRRISREKRSAPAKPCYRSAPAHPALAACRAELQTIARTATVLAKKSPGRGGPGDRGLKPRMGRAEARTVAANGLAHTANSLCL